MAAGASSGKAVGGARRRARNVAVESALKTHIRRATELIEATDLKAAEAAVVRAIAALDKAAQKGVIHPNNAAGRKSRLVRRYHVAKIAASSN